MFRDWDSYFLLIGGSSGALISLLFVVVTLTSGLDGRRAARGASIYMTPTVIRLGVVLSLSAVALAPGLPGLIACRIIAATAGAGLIYMVITGVRMRNPIAEAPHWSDPWCYAVIPGLLYLALGATALIAGAGTWLTERAIALTILVLMLIAIRNAWDLVTWLAPRTPEPETP